MAFERADRKNAWQFPQGGIDEGEDPVEGAWRELEEETGLTAKHVRLVGEYPEWTVYEWPDGAKLKGQRLGQAQRWFFFEAKDDDIEPEPDGVEFEDWKWVKVDWLIDNVVDFRKASYRRVLGDS